MISILINSQGLLDIGSLSKADAAALIAPQVLKIISKYKANNESISIEVMMNDHDSGDYATCKVLCG